METKTLPILHLHVKDEYFQQIKDRSKPWEYRIRNDYWKKRLFNRKYKEIHIHSGYPKKGDVSKTIIRKWNGYVEVNITHKHFGPNLVDVFAILVKERIGN